MSPIVTRRSPVRAFYRSLFGLTDAELDELLTARTWDILTRRLVDGESLVDVGKVYGITRERVRQIECSAMATLRRRARPVRR